MDPVLFFETNLQSSLLAWNTCNTYSSQLGLNCSVRSWWPQNSFSKTIFKINFFLEIVVIAFPRIKVWFVQYKGREIESRVVALKISKFMKL
jgi:hypothetical protein